MKDVHETLRNNGVIPVLRIEDPRQAIPLGQALTAGGIDVAEVTFRTESAAESIRRLTGGMSGLLVGAGTILTIDDAKKALDAGARFIVSPGYDDELVQWCIEHEVPVYPGVSTPSEIERAMRRGVSVLKLFPAEALGGTAMIDALAGPFPGIRFIPTGGIGIDNLASYLKKPSVLACGGSWMVKPQLVNDSRWDEIILLCQDAVAAMHGFSFAHLGVNPERDGEAHGIAEMLGTLLQPVVELPASLFAGPAIEIMKEPGRGAHGHLGIRTWDIERALYHLSRLGLESDYTSARYDEHGRLKLIYLKGEVAGFALHLVRG